jgi:hypothetical protein
MPGRRPGPSVQDNEKYEAQRDQGASKEKAARIANAGRQQGSSPSRSELIKALRDQWSPDRSAHHEALEVVLRHDRLELLDDRARQGVPDALGQSVPKSSNKLL